MPSASSQPSVSSDSQPHLSVAAPCFNEAEGIEAVLREWDAVLAECPFEGEIVICNDGSTDDTGQVLTRLADELPRLRVVNRPENKGYGRALSAAIANTRGRFIATLDSDGQFDLRDGLELLEKLESEGLDAVTGYRVAKNDSLLRVVADRGLNRLVRTLFPCELRDTNCALKVVTGDILRRLPVEAQGYSTPTEICLRLAAAGHRMGEAPVRHLERTAGTSKLQPMKTAWGMFRFLLYLRAQLSLMDARIISQP